MEGPKVTGYVKDALKEEWSLEQISSRIKDRIDIDERPKVVDQRKRLGDGEGDTVEDAKGFGYLTT